jgi:hypothetical protein
VTDACVEKEKVSVSEEMQQEVVSEEESLQLLSYGETQIVCEQVVMVIAPDEWEELGNPIT